MIGIAEVLVERLEDRGFEQAAIAGFIRDVCNTISTDQYIGLNEINRRLHQLGWDSVELDAHTLQLIVALCETHDRVEKKDILLRPL
jgi:hypothetical protein